MTKLTDPLAQIRKEAEPRWWSRAAILTVAAAVVLAAPLLAPQADGALDNGGFCLASTYTGDPGIRGQSGNCEAAPTHEEAAKRIMGVGPAQ
jgi:hypothetical protein